MNATNYHTDTGIEDRPPRRRPEPTRAITDENLPLDHHVEEVLAALSDLAGLVGTHHRRS